MRLYLSYFRVEEISTIYTGPVVSATEHYDNLDEAIARAKQRLNERINELSWTDDDDDCILITDENGHKLKGFGGSVVKGVTLIREF